MFKTKTYSPLQLEQFVQLVEPEFGKGFLCLSILTSVTVEVGVSEGGGGVREWNWRLPLTP